MIDFIKAEVEFPESILQNEFFQERIREVKIETGEIVGNKCTIDLLGFKFHIFDSNRIFINGSLHKYKNEGRGNYDDFKAAELERVIRQLSQLFGFNWENLILRNLEYGVNINPPVPTKQIIEGIMFYKTTEFKNIKQFHSGHFKRADFQRFSIKCYDKKIQYRKAIMDETFRFEIHVRKMDYLKEIGIVRISDLLCPSKIEKLGCDLKLKWNSILFFDFTVNLNDNEFLFLQWSNTNYWRGLREKHRNNRKRISIEKSKMAFFMKEYSSDMKDRISNLIEDKWMSLAGLKSYKIKSNSGEAGQRNKRLLQLHS